MWNWLIANGLYKDLVSAAILVPMLKLMGSHFAKKVADEVVKAAKNAEHDMIRAAKDEFDNVR